MCQEFFTNTIKIVNYILTTSRYTCARFEMTRSGKVFMSLDRDTLLIVWEAMNLLAEVNMYPDAPQIKKLLSDAEGALCRLTIELAMRAELQDPSECNNVTLH